MLADVIRFGPGCQALSYYESIHWDLEETHGVEFFPGVVFQVLLTSTESPNFEQVLNSYDDGGKIALDLEWETELCLFQFCSSKGVLIVRHPPGEGNEALREFLKAHKFYAKGIHNDKLQLKAKFGEDFAENIEDIAQTRLVPYGHSETFMTMTVQFAGEPTAEFKDSRITTSDWSLPELSARQVLYAAFDVVALYQAYPNFPPPGIKQKVKTPSLKRPRPVVRSFSDPVKSPRPPKKEKTRKDFWTKIVLKPSQAHPIFCYLFEGYRGPISCLDLRNVCLNVEREDIDYIGYFGGYLLVSLLKDLPVTLKHGFDRMIQLPQLDPADYSDSDIYFLEKMPSVFASDDLLDLFFYAFGTDHRLTNEEYYIRVQIHRAQASLRFKTFLPYLLIDDGKPLPFFDFPSFLPVIRAIVPSGFTLEQTELLFGKYGNVVNVKHLRQRTPQTPNTAIVTFQSVDEAENALLANYQVVDNCTIYVQRFVDEPYVRLLRSRELLCRRDSLEESSFRKSCEKYGKIFAVYWDKLMKVEHIQYYDKKSVYRALESEPDMELIPTGTVAFIRNLPLQMAEQDALELASRFGVVKTLIFQDLDEFMRTSIAEVVFESEDQAAALKHALHQMVFGNEILEINAINAKNCDAPIWKMQQRKCWLVCKTFTDTNHALEECSAYGTVVDIVQREEAIYVRFLTAEMCEKAATHLQAEVPLPIQFATRIEPSSFTLMKEAFRPRKGAGHQIMAIVIDPLPESLTKEKIQEIVRDPDDFDIIIVRSRQAAHMRRAIVYTKSKRAMSRGYGKLYNQRVDGELLCLFRYELSEIPNPPKYTPFASLRKPRKMAIVVDPIPDTMTESSVEAMMTDCGKYDIRITRSAVSEGRKRLIIQPRNLRAKSECFRILGSTVIDNVALCPFRVKPEEIPKPLDDSDEEEEIFF